MRFALLVALTGIITMTAPAAAADLPEPAQLPAVADFPDPLVNLAGKKIATPQQWKSERRAELKTLFQHYMYGQLPDVPRELSWQVEYEDRTAFGGRATLREVAVTPAKGCPPLHLLLVTPNAAREPAPVFVGMNFCGNHALVKDPKIRIPECWMYPGPGVTDNRATEAGRGNQAETWAIDDIIDRGYALATLYNGDVDPDVKGEGTAACGRG